MKNIALPLIAAAMLQAVMSHAAEDYPSRAVVVVDSYPPGGASDVLMRLIGKRMQEVTGQPLVIEAKPGAAGTIGATFVARAKPDGYTLLVSNSGPNAIAPTVFPKLAYDVKRDFTPVMRLTTLPMFYCVASGSRFTTLSALLEASKAGQINFGSTGNGGLGHLTGEILNKGAGARMTHIGYRGAAPVINAVLAQEIHMGVLSGPDANPHMQAGKMRCLAVASAKRSALAPNVPTAAEAGVPGVVSEGWFGLFAPAATPPAVISKLNSSISSILAESAMRARMAEIGLEAAANRPSEFQAIVHQDTDKYAEIVKAVGIKIE
jgi:Uncharacterized protein conserved in bacteria